MRIDKYIKKRNTNTRKFTQIHIKLLLITNSIDTYRKTQSNLNMCDYQKRNEKSANAQKSQAFNMVLIINSVNAAFFSHFVREKKLGCALFVNFLKRLMLNIWVLKAHLFANLHCIVRRFYPEGTQIVK